MHTRVTNLEDVIRDLIAELAMEDGDMEEDDDAYEDDY